MSGYLVDQKGNIIDKKGINIFKKNSLMFNEPPKFFQFMKFNVKDIIGECNIDTYGNMILINNEDLEGNIKYYDNNGR